MTQQMHTVEWSAFKLVADDRPTWGVYRITRPLSTRVYVAASDVVYRATLTPDGEVDEPAEFATRYAGRIVDVDTEDDVLGLSALLSVSLALKNAEGAPVVAQAFRVVDETYRNIGRAFVAAPGQTTHDDFEITSASVLVSGAHVTVAPTSVRGDHMDFSIVHKGGDGSVTTLTTYVIGHRVPEVIMAGLRSSYMREIVPGTYAPVPGGLFLRASYTSTGGAPVAVELDYHIFER